MSHRRRHGEINVSSPWTWISVVPSPGMKFNNRDIPPDTHLCFPSLFSYQHGVPRFCTGVASRSISHPSQRMMLSSSKKIWVPT